MCAMQLVEKQTDFSLKKFFFECFKQAFFCCFFFYCSFLAIANALVADACLNVGGKKKTQHTSIAF